VPEIGDGLVHQSVDDVVGVVVALEPGKTRTPNFMG